MSNTQSDLQSVQDLILEAVCVLGALALQRRGTRVSATEQLKMQDRLFHILEELNDYKEG